MKTIRETKKNSKRKNSSTSAKSPIPKTKNAPEKTPVKSNKLSKEIEMRKQSEKAQRQSEKKFRTLLENIQECYFEVDLAGNLTFFNDSLCRIHGCSKEEMMGVNNRQYTDKENAKKLFQAFNKVYNTRKSLKGFDWQIIRKDGTKRYIEASVSLKEDSSGKPIGFIGISRDITEHRQAEEKLNETLENLRKSIKTTIQVLGIASETRDPYTAGHQKRVADLARAIATEMKLPHDKIEGIRMAGAIHDIGKISIPSEILSKPTILPDLEFSLIKAHTQYSYEIIKDVESPWPLADIVYQHHERINGSGYPQGLKGEDILIEARILAVADVVEAMISNRPYRPALGVEMALTEIEQNAGILYDRKVANACLKLFRNKGFKLE
jgi:PAS domain S-box-containing protein